MKKLEIHELDRKIKLQISIPTFCYIHVVNQFQHKGLGSKFFSYYFEGLFIAKVAPTSRFDQHLFNTSNDCQFTVSNWGYTVGHNNILVTVFSLWFKLSTFTVLAVLFKLSYSCSIVGLVSSVIGQWCRCAGLEFHAIKFLIYIFLSFLSSC